MRQLIAPEPPYSAFLSVPGVKETSLVRRMRASSEHHATLPAFLRPRQSPRDNSDSLDVKAEKRVCVLPATDAASAEPHRQHQPHHNADEPRRARRRAARQSEHHLRIGADHGPDAPRSQALPFAGPFRSILRFFSNIDVIKSLHPLFCVLPTFFFVG